jgi:hypothetical protein
MVKPEDLNNLKRVDLTVGGDSGGGFFRMLLKVCSVSEITKACLVFFRLPVFHILKTRSKFSKKGS